MRTANVKQPLRASQTEPQKIATYLALGRAWRNPEASDLMDFFVLQSERTECWGRCIFSLQWNCNETVMILKCFIVGFVL
jgi:hypothetical protein